LVLPAISAELDAAFRRAILAWRNSASLPRPFKEDWRAFAVRLQAAAVFESVAQHAWLRAGLEHRSENTLEENLSHDFRLWADAWRPFGRPFTTSESGNRWSATSLRLHQHPCARIEQQIDAQ